MDSVTIHGPNMSTFEYIYILIWEINLNGKSLWRHWNSNNSLICLLKLTFTFAPFSFNEVDVVAGPNNRRFILRPCDHANKHHDKSSSSTTSTKSSAVQKRPLKQNNSTLICDGSGQLRTDKQTTLTGVNHQSGKKTPLNQQQPKSYLFEKPKNKDQIWSQNFSLSVVQTGIIKHHKPPHMISMILLSKVWGAGTAQSLVIWNLMARKYHHPHEQPSTTTIFLQFSVQMQCWTRKHGCDNFETFVPTPKMSSVRMMM